MSVVEHNILRYDDIQAINQVITEIGAENCNLEIVCKVDDLYTLNRINEDYFYRHSDNTNEKPTELKNDFDEVAVTIGKTRFIYRVNDNN